MKYEKIKLLSCGILLGVILACSIGFVILEPAFDNIRRELIASRNDAERDHNQYDATQGKLTESITIISGSETIINGTITTLRDAIETIRKCRGIISTLKSILQGP